MASGWLGTVWSMADRTADDVSAALGRLAVSANARRSSAMQRDVATVEAEIERLRIWQAEATIVLKAWDKVYVALGSPGRPGDSMAAAALAEVSRLTSLVDPLPESADPGWQCHGEGFAAQSCTRESPHRGCREMNGGSR